MSEEKKMSASAERTKEVIDEVSNLSVGETPDTSTARAINNQFGGSIDVEGVNVQSIEVTEGRPEHGALMSYAHVSRAEIVWENCVECWKDDCNCRTRRLVYNRNHNISHSEEVMCDKCGHKFTEKRYPE